MNDALAQCLRAQLSVSTNRTPMTAASIAIKRGNEDWVTVITTRDGDPAKSLVSVGSRFLIYSLTKSFSAVIILRMVASGKLTLDAPLSRWLPDIPNAPRITIRHCLQHTSGLPDYGQLPEYHAAVRAAAKPWSFQEFLKRAQATQLVFDPGCGWGYSNIGYMVLRRLIEDVCGKSFAAIVTDEICKPLSLADTAVVTDRADLRDLAVGYSTYLSSGGYPVDVRDIYDPAWVATGVVASTASDVVRFYHELFGGHILPPSLVAEMCSLVRVADSHPPFVTPSYGLGLMADPDSRHGAIYGHNGEGPGYAASAYHFKTLQVEPVTVAVLSNSENPLEVQNMALSAGGMLAASLQS